MTQAPRPRDTTQLVRDLAETGPMSRPPDEWASELLDLVQRLPTEAFEVATDAVTRALTVALSPRQSARARLELAYNARPIDRLEVIERAVELAATGDAVNAVFALRRVARYARGQGYRAAGELLCLAMLAVVDVATGEQPLTLDGTATVGRDAHAELLTRAWESVAELDTGTLGSILASASTNPAVAPAEHFVARALAFAAETLRDLPGTAPTDAVWVRSAFLHGLAYAVPALGEARYVGYLEYAERRETTAKARSTLRERYSQALTLSGRLRDAMAVLDAATGELPPLPELPHAHLAVLRGYARMWRMAGDPARGLEFSDRAVAILADDEGEPVDAAPAGNTWLNRAPILRDLGRREDAYEAAANALASFMRDPLLGLGQIEARQQLCSCDPHRSRAAEEARRLLALFDAGELPQPITANTLYEAGNALADVDAAEATRAYAAAADQGSEGRRQRPLALIGGARLHLRLSTSDVDETARRELLQEAIRWAETAVRSAQQQANNVLIAQAQLILSRCLAEAGEQLEAAASAGREGLVAATHAVAAITTDGSQRVLSALRDDLSVLFDVAVALDDGELAVRVAELGRGLRLAAMVRLDPASLPPDVRQALADAAAANLRQNEDTSEASEEGGESETRALREVAREELDATRRRLEQICGSILRDIATDISFDPQRFRDTFADAHVVTLTERHGVVRWTWWRPGEPAAACGRTALSSTARRNIALFAEGAASSRPGDLTSWLQELFPPPLLKFLSEVSQPPPVVISPVGRLWHLPLLATPLPGNSSNPARQRLLVHAAHVTLTPSLALVAAVEERDAREHRAAMTTRTAVMGGRDGRLAMYCNPKLPGAQLEEETLQRLWPCSPLPGVREFGTTSHHDLAVVATHADRGPGLSQSVRDHLGQRLAAGECVVRAFPRTVVLGTCNGDGVGDADDDSDPTGLLTVIAARGTTWAIGGHQEISDATAAVILSRTYGQLARGGSLADALRDAQLWYLDAVAEAISDGADHLPPELRDVADKAGSPATLTGPWYWALTIVGPPATTNARLDVTRTA